MLVLLFMQVQFNTEKKFLTLFNLNKIKNPWAPEMIAYS